MFIYYSYLLLYLFYFDLLQLWEDYIVFKLAIVASVALKSSSEQGEAIQILSAVIFSR